MNITSEGAPRSDTKVTVGVYPQVRWDGLILYTAGRPVFEIPFPHDEPGIDIAPAVVGNVPNPSYVKAWADVKGYEIDPLSWELMTGRWLLRVEGTKAPFFDVMRELAELRKTVEICLLPEDLARGRTNLGNDPACAACSERFHTGCVSSEHTCAQSDVVGIALARKRRVVIPVFVVGVTPTELAPYLVKLFANFRFDATTLPVDGLHFEGQTNGLALGVDIRVPDRDKPEVDYGTVRRSMICPWAPIRNNGVWHVARFVRETIANLLSHEVDECIAIEDARVFDPHRSLLPEQEAP